MPQHADNDKNNIIQMFISDASVTAAASLFEEGLVMGFDSVDVDSVVVARLFLISRGVFVYELCVDVVF